MWTRSSTGITSSPSPSLSMAHTTRRGRRSRRSPSSPNASSSVRSSTAARTATRICRPTWPAPSITSARIPPVPDASSSAPARDGRSATTTATATPSARRASRLDALAEDLPRIRRRWDALNPPPTRRIPILIGGQGEQKTLRLVARHADIWHAFTGLSDLPRKIGVLHDWCAREGRDPATIELSSGFTIRGFGPLLEEGGAERLYALGARLLIPAVGGPDYDLSMLGPLLRWRDRVNGEG